MALSRLFGGMGLSLIAGLGAWGQSYTISTYAGGAPPPTPAPGVSDSIGSPLAAATDAAGNVYFVSDGCVFKLDQNSVLTRVAGTSRGGYSGDGGPAANAQLASPQGVAVDDAGNLYIADSFNYRVRKVTPAGIISTIAGNGISGYSGDGGPAVNAGLVEPYGVAVDSADNLYVSDLSDYRIRKVTLAGIISTVAGNGTRGFSGDGGPATSAELFTPEGVAVDAAGNLYIADTSIDRVREVTPAGIISTVAGEGGGATGLGDGGPATSAQLADPAGVAVDSVGNLYIADTGDERIRKVTPAGIITTVAGGEFAGLGDGGPAANAQLLLPQGIAVDGTGNLYIADTANNRVRKVTAVGIITTVAGNGTHSYSGDGGVATSAQLSLPDSAAVDAAGNAYIADRNNNRIRKVTPAGIITTIAGNGTAGYSGDGGPATSAELSNPQGVAVDSAGNVYIADTGNNRIREVTPAGIIATVAGNGIYGSSGDGGPATSAVVGQPEGAAVDRAGNVYFAEPGSGLIRRVTPSGIITTVAGGGTAGLGDGGPATSAELGQPTAVAVDSAGDLYIADLGNNRIRKVTPAGIITTVAGNGTAGYSGDGGPATSAELNEPAGVAADSAGNVYIADTFNIRIREVTAAGIITTVAGNGNGGYSGDGGPATSAELSSPEGLAVDAPGSVYIADFSANAIRLLSPATSTNAPAVTSGGIAPAWSSVNTIQPGEWISIYGTNLAGSVASWNGTFTTSLNGTSVTIGGEAAYISYVSPTQVNAQAPDDSATGTVSVTVTTANGTASGTATLAAYAPSFLLLDGTHVAGIILRTNGSGAYGAGTYDILGPTGSSLGYATVAAKAGDTVELFAVGLGPTNPTEPAGQTFAGAAPVVNPVTVLINNAAVSTSFVGLSGAGLYQINLTVPSGVGAGDVPLQALAGGAQTQSGVVIALQ